MNVKTYIKYILVLLVLAGCSKDDNKNTSNPIDQLPPMTTSGKNTIGCLVNGVPFTDGGLMNNFYQLVEGEYYLVINWENGFGDNFKAGQIGLRKTQVVEGATYILNNDKTTLDLPKELLDLIRSKQFTPEQIRVMFPDVTLPVVGIEA